MVPFSHIMLLRGRKVSSMRALQIWGSFQCWSTGSERRGGKGVVEDTCDLGEVCSTKHGYWRWGKKEARGALGLPWPAVANSKAHLILCALTVLI